MTSDNCEIEKILAARRHKSEPDWHCTRGACAPQSYPKSRDFRLKPAVPGAQYRQRIVKTAAAAPNSSARKIIVALAVLITVCLLSLIIAGVTSLISLAERIHPIAGTIVFWSVCLAAGFFALYCVIAYAKLPAALVPPEEESGPKYDAYLQALRVRLEIGRAHV